MQEDKSSEGEIVKSAPKECSIRLRVVNLLLHEVENPHALSLIHWILGNRGSMERKGEEGRRGRRRREGLPSRKE